MCAASSAARALIASSGVRPLVFTLLLCMTLPIGPLGARGGDGGCGGAASICVSLVISASSLAIVASEAVSVASAAFSVASAAFRVVSAAWSSAFSSGFSSPDSCFRLSSTMRAFASTMRCCASAMRACASAARACTARNSFRAAALSAFAAATRAWCSSKGERYDHCSTSFPPVGWSSSSRGVARPRRCRTCARADCEPRGCSIFGSCRLICPVRGDIGKSIATSESACSGDMAGGGPASRRSRGGCRGEHDRESWFQRYGMPTGIDVQQRNAIPQAEVFHFRSPFDQRLLGNVLRLQIPAPLSPLWGAKIWVSSPPLPPLHQGSLHPTRVCVPPPGTLRIAAPLSAAHRGTAAVTGLHEAPWLPLSLWRHHLRPPEHGAHHEVCHTES